MESEVTFELCLFVHTFRRAIVAFTFREKTNHRTMCCVQ